MLAHVTSSTTPPSPSARTARSRMARATRRILARATRPPASARACRSAHRRPRTSRPGRSGRRGSRPAVARSRAADRPAERARRGSARRSDPAAIHGCVPIDVAVRARVGLVSQAVCRVSGSQTSGSTSVQMPTNPGGVMPITVTPTPLTTIVCPTAARRRRARASRKPSLITATGSSRSAPDIAGVEQAAARRRHAERGEVAAGDQLPVRPGHAGRCREAGR